jgi:phosphoglycerol transferase MdoB-like AlkP superfamily enzyme
LLKNLERQPIEKLQYMSEEAVSKEVCVALSLNKVPNQMNVVILLVESLGSEYMGAGNPYPGFTPFIDSLANAGLNFNNHFANGRTSIDAVPAILLGVPRLMNEEFASSGYENNNWIGLGHQLKQNGYQTAFFHGGKNGTMSFDFLSKLGGLEKYYGMSEYPDPKDYDGNWGIFDLPFLQFTASEINRLPQPFGAMVFTLSSHQPYTIPDPFKGRFPKGNLDIHESLGYADHSIRQFFKTASSMPWYANTLFVITGDHTQMTDQQAYQTPWGYYDVPLIFFHPKGKYLTANTDRFCQHADISPSVLDALGIAPTQKSCIGRSVFSLSEGLALNVIDGKRSLLADSLMVQISETGQTSNIPFLASKTVNSDKEKANEQLLKAHLQYFNNRLLNNQWYQP